LLPSNQTSRKLEVFLLHGHQEGQPINYRALFEYLATLPPTERAGTRIGKLVALRTLEIEGDRVRLTAYEGPLGESPLIYNQLSAEERIERLARGEVLARKTHAMLSLLTRELIVEYNQRGAKLTDIVNLCQYLALRHPDWNRLDLIATPIVEPSFLEALNRYRVIKTATVKVARPNQNWNADLKNMLGEMASDSDARMADVTLYASRRGTLSRTGGLVAYIRQMISGAVPSVAGATISGIREGESADSSISLSKHIQAQVVSVGLTQDGYVNDEDIESKIQDYLNSRERPS
jgi:hypothetical protein